jgi:hypothetical protein
MQKLGLHSFKRPTLLLAIGLGLTATAWGQTQTSPVPDDLRIYLEILRSDVNAEKVRALNRVLKLNESESEVFWPIYRRYEGELAQLGERKLELIRRFIDNYDRLDQVQAAALTREWLDLLQARLDLWKTYQRQISQALSPVRAAQFLQVEHQMALFIDLNIAAEMPAVGPGTNAEQQR